MLSAFPALLTSPLVCLWKRRALWIKGPSVCPRLCLHQSHPSMLHTEQNLRSCLHSCLPLSLETGRHGASYTRGLLCHSPPSLLNQDHLLQIMLPLIPQGYGPETGNSHPLCVCLAQEASGLIPPPSPKSWYCPVLPLCSL